MPELEASPVLAAEPTVDHPAPPDVRAPRDPQVGRQLGKYRVRRRLGQGGMGVVYEAEDTVLKRRVALKFLPHTVSDNPQNWQRFLLEAQAAARLNHANAVAIYEIDQRDGSSFIAMEYVDGGSTHDHLKADGPYSWPLATEIVAEVCRGLAAAHLAGLIHRDIKPANIMHGPDGTVKLADFGLAKATDSSVSSITGSNSAVGTPSFMSPEQCQCEYVDHRCDIYSLGATYYSLLVGKPPFGSGGPLEVMFAHCSRPAPDPREVFPDIPEVCAAVVRKAMAKEPAERFQSAEEMLTALLGVLDHPAAADALPPRGKRPSTVVPVDTVTLPRPELSEPEKEAKSLGQGRQWRKVPLTAAGILLGAAIGIVTFFQPLTRGEQPGPRNGSTGRPPSTPEPSPPPPAVVVTPPSQDLKPPPKKPPRETRPAAQPRPRVVIVLPSRSYLPAEFMPVRNLLRDLGAEVRIASPTGQPVPAEFGNLAPSVSPDLPLDQVHSRNFDALVICGGQGIADSYVGDGPAALRLRHLLVEMRRDRKVVAGFGMATGILVKAGVARGEEVACPPVLRSKLLLEGARVSNTPLTISNGLVTGHAPATVPQFAHALAREVGLQPGPPLRDAGKRGNGP